MYKLWELQLSNGTRKDLIISRIRVDRGTFNDYDDAVNEAKRLCSGLGTSIWELEELHDSNNDTQDGGEG